MIMITMMMMRSMVSCCQYATAQEVEEDEFADLGPAISVTPKTTDDDHQPLGLDAPTLHHVRHSFLSYKYKCICICIRIYLICNV